MKRFIKLDVIFAIGLIILATGPVFLELSEAKQREKDKKRMEAEFAKRERELNHKLQESKKYRDSLQVKFDSLFNINKELIKQDSLLTVELNSIKGRYDNLTSKELYDRMILEYRNARQAN